MQDRSCVLAVTVVILRSGPFPEVGKAPAPWGTGARLAPTGNRPAVPPGRQTSIQTTGPGGGYGVGVPSCSTAPALSEVRASRRDLESGSGEAGAPSAFTQTPPSTLQLVGPGPVRTHRTWFQTPNHASANTRVPRFLILSIAGELSLYFHTLRNFQPKLEQSGAPQP